MNDACRVVHGVVSAGARRRVLRLIHLDIVEHGIDPHVWQTWRSVACPFPHLRFDPAITDLSGLVLHAVCSGAEYQPCEPQIVYQFPDHAEQWDTPPHVDSPPPWASGRRYAAIIGVALTDWNADNGGLLIWDGETPVPVALKAGDVLSIRPDVPHATGLNRSGLPRIGLYFRFLENDRG